MTRRAGMPKWKSKREALPTLNHTRRGFRLKDGRLHLAGGIVVRVVWSRELPAEPSSVRVYQDSLGHWHCSFVVPAEVQPLPRTGRVLGVHWGVKQTATTTSDAYDLPHAEYGGKAQKKLVRYDRMMARRRPQKRQPASKGYREAKKLRAMASKKVARQREDTGRKWAKKVVRNHDAVAVEDFRPKFLAKTTMARKAADAPSAPPRPLCSRLAANTGGTSASSTPRTPRWTAPTALREPSTHCRRVSAPTAAPHCGTVSPRDKNSARVMLLRAGLNPAGVDGGRPPGALLQEAA